LCDWGPALEKHLEECVEEGRGSETESNPVCAPLEDDEEGEVSKDGEEEEKLRDVLEVELLSRQRINTGVGVRSGYAGTRKQAL
jgi:hypothetical protein